MRAVGRWTETLVRRLDLPEELLPGAARLTLTGGRTLRIENHRCLLSFSDELLEAGCGRQRLRICGRDLRIRAMDRQEILLEGTILSVEVEGA